MLQLSNEKRWPRLIRGCHADDYRAAASPPLVEGRCIRLSPFLMKIELVAFQPDS